MNIELKKTRTSQTGKLQKNKLKLLLPPPK